MKRPLILIVILSATIGILFLNFSSPTNFNTRIETNHIARLEKLQEKLFLLLKFDKNRKADYYQYLLEKRLAELKYAVTSGQIDLIEETASRYTTYLGNLNNLIIQNRMSDRKDSLLKTYAEHSQIITNLQTQFKFESGWWLAIQHDINTLQLFSDQIKSL